jgi:hypothetical protein
MSWIRNNVPDKTCRHHTFGGTYARVGQAVDGVEDPQPYIRRWHKWPGDVTGWLPLPGDSPHCPEGGLLSCLQRARTASWPGGPPSWRRRCLLLVARQPRQLPRQLPCQLPRQLRRQLPRQLPRQEVKVERISACLPTGLQAWARRALLHRSPQEEAPVLSRVMAACTANLGHIRTE